MAHARLIKTCQLCQKTIRVDIVQNGCENSDCSDTQRETFAYCPICHKTTDQLASLVHIGTTIHQIDQPLGGPNVS
jgi:hypothetical protein